MSKKREQELKDALQEIIGEVGQLSARMDPILNGHTETTASIMDKTTFGQTRKTTMKDAKEICRHMRIRINDIITEAEQVIYGG